MYLQMKSNRKVSSPFVIFIIIISIRLIFFISLFFIFVYYNLKCMHLACSFRYCLFDFKQVSRYFNTFPIVRADMLVKD